MRPFLLSLLMIMAAALAGCAMVPAQEMSDARQAIQAAETAGADTHAPRALDHARALLEQAEAELAVQDYAAARRSARESKDAAIQAREAADDAAHAPAGQR
jgi:long-subunit acyl-CoA synthetase (AMP-forming)